MGRNARAWREQVADQDSCAAEPEMRRVGKEPRRQRQVENTVDQDAEIEIAAAGEKPEQAIGKIEHAEQLEEPLGGAARGEGGSGRPQCRYQMQAVGVPGAAEQAED